MNLRHYLDLHGLEDFIDASRAAANKDGWTLVVLPMIFMGEERFQYYYVVPDQHVIAWQENLNGELLFGECIQPSEWRHKSMLPLPLLFFSSLIVITQDLNSRLNIGEQLPNDVTLVDGAFLTARQETL